MIRPSDSPKPPANPSVRDGLLEVVHNPEDKTVRPGDQPVRDDEIPAIIKFDGVSAQSDRTTLGEPQRYNRVEQAYNRMARDAGIVMPEIQTVGEGDYRHLIVPRFDIDADGTTYHMHTLSGLRQRSHRNPGGESYTGLLRTARGIGLGTQSQVRLFRRMVFNVAAVNQDDHVKNHAFLMGPNGEWELAPAYDLTYTNGEGFTSAHQLLVNGKRSGMTMKDLRTVGKQAGLQNHRMDDVLNDVFSVVSNWPDYAEQYDVPEPAIDRIQNAMDQRMDSLKQRNDSTPNESFTP